MKENIQEGITPKLQGILPMDLRQRQNSIVGTLEIIFFADDSISLFFLYCVISLEKRPLSNWV
jgi:hypothetical protein